MQLSIKLVKGKKYTKNVLVFAVELLCVSLAAYRLIRNSQVILLPQEKVVRELMNESFQDENIKTLFEKLSPSQLLVNILFDEVKLKRALRFSNSHIIGLAENDSGELASSALVTELICCHGGPRLVIRIIPVSCLNGKN